MSARRVHPPRGRGDLANTVAGALLTESEARSRKAGVVPFRVLKLPEVGELLTAVSANRSRVCRHYVKALAEEQTLRLLTITLGRPTLLCRAFRADVCLQQEPDRRRSSRYGDRRVSGDSEPKACVA